MRNILGIIGSPRRMGNCELLVKEIAARLPGPVALRMVRLPDKDIRPCRACYRCLTGECPIEDDFGVVLSALLAADGVIVAAPAYLHGTHSSIQRFLDRGLGFWRHVDALAGKPAVAVATAGMEDGEGFALMGVENLVRASGMALKGRALVRAALPGEALLSEEGPAAASRLAAALVAPGEFRADGPACTECGGTYFEFRGANRVYCLMCGGSGEVFADGGAARIRTRPPRHTWRGPEAMKAHGEWLIGMKEKYRRERENLKALARDRAGGEFI
ncbi:MAG: flavodoxin family protein [Gemmatimonadota bacterium]